MYCLVVFGLAAVWVWVSLLGALWIAGLRVLVATQGEVAAMGWVVEGVVVCVAWTVEGAVVVEATKGCCRGCDGAATSVSGAACTAEGETSIELARSFSSGKLLPPSSSSDPSSESESSSSMASNEWGPSKVGRCCEIVRDGAVGLAAGELGTESPVGESYISCSQPRFDSEELKFEMVFGLTTDLGNSALMGDEKYIGTDGWLRRPKGNALMYVGDCVTNTESPMTIN